MNSMEQVAALYPLAIAAVSGWAAGQLLAAAAVFGGGTPRTKAQQVNTPGAHARHLARRHLPALWAVAGFGAAGIIAALWSAQSNNLVALTAAAAAIGLVAAHQAPLPIVRTMRRTIAGAKAEERVARTLGNLPGAWVVLNSVMTGTSGDADHIAVGQWGVAVIETKSGGGPLTWRNGTLKAGTKPILKDPVAQVRRQSELVSRITGQPVTAIVCVPNATNALTVGNVTICNLGDLRRVLNRADTHFTQVAGTASVQRLGETHRQYSRGQT